MPPRFRNKKSGKPKELRSDVSATDAPHETVVLPGRAFRAPSALGT